MVDDLSTYHHPIGTTFARESTDEEGRRYRFPEDQIESFRKHGYLKGIRILDDDLVEILRGELEQLMDAAHPGRPLFHEYHSNESTDPNRILFHALGAWRVLPGFHDLLWNPAFLVP